MKYKDICSEELLNQFGKYKDKVGDIELSDAQESVDVFKIAEVCNIDMKKFKERYGSFKSDEEKRFCLAREIYWQINDVDKKKEKWMEQLRKANKEK